MDMFRVIISVSFLTPCVFLPQVREVALVFGPPYGLQGGKPGKPAKTNCITSYWQGGRNCVPIICLWFANWELNLLLALFCICLFLYFPLFPLLPGSLSLFPPLYFEKSCKESRLLNPWIYDPGTVSSTHVNYPNICIWVSLQKGPNTSTNQFQFHLMDNCQFIQRWKFYQYPSSILPLTNKVIFLLPHLFAWMTYFRLKVGTDPFSNFTIHTAAPAIVIAPYTDEMSSAFLRWRRRGKESHAKCEGKYLYINVFLCVYINHHTVSKSHCKG